MLFLNNNYQEIHSFNVKEIKSFFDDSQEEIDYLIYFYNILSITGISSSIILLLLNVPYLNECYAFEEQVIMIITRTHSSNALNEILKMRRFKREIKNLLKGSTKKEYILGNISKAFVHTLKKQSTNKIANRYAQREHNFLSSLIYSQKRSKKESFIMIIISIISVCGYFCLIFYFQIKIKDTLNNILIINNKFKEFKNAFGYLNIAETKFFNISNLEKNEKIEYFNNYKLYIAKMLDFYVNSINIFIINENLHGESKKEFEKIFYEKICVIIKDKLCDENSKNYNISFVDYLSERLKWLREIIPSINNGHAINYETLQKNFIKAFLILKIIHYFEIKIDNLGIVIINRLVIIIKN